MVVGVPKEIKNSEKRVAITPGGASVLVDAGHTVVVETEAGEGSGVSDADYSAAGAKILPSASEVYSQADMIMKIKEPLPPEYRLLRPGQTVFTYFHLASDEELTEAIVQSGVIAIAYETVQLSDGSLPLLSPMSEVAGAMAAHVGAYYLAGPRGGRGVLMGGIPGVEPAHVTVVGGGTVGASAALMAAGLGAEVTLLEVSPMRMTHLSHVLPRNVKILYSTRQSIEAAVVDADLVIGAVLIPGAKAPKLVTCQMVARMRKGAVIVDVAVDQGGCVETTHPTTHDDPVYLVNGVLHYAVANMPGAFPRTSTYALTNVTLPYALKFANMGPERALKADPALRKGLNVYRGRITYRAVAETFGRAYCDPEEFL